MKYFIPHLMTAGLVGVLLLSACQAAVLPSQAPAAQSSVPTQTPSPIPLPEDAAVLATATPLPMPSATLTPGVSSELAVQTVQEYFTALQNNDYKAAANLFSTFSLTVDGLTRGNAADELHTLLQAGTRWSDLQIKDSQVLGDQTVLVHVLYTLTTQDAKTGQKTALQKDELWPLRYENNRWRYNRNNLIDFHTLSIPDQSMAGLRMKPLQLIRYSDHISLMMMVQNTTNDTIVLGQPNEIMAAFTFDDKKVEADKQQLIFQRLRSYSKIAIELKGLFSAYPDGVIIRQWKDLQVPPWFTFRFSE